MQMHARADAGPERAQQRVLEYRSLEQAPRHEPHAPLYDPVAQVETAPHRRPCRPIRADQQPFGGHGQQRRNQSVHHDTRDVNERREHDDEIRSNRVDDGGKSVEAEHVHDR